MTAQSPVHAGRFDLRATLRRMESPTAPYYLLLGATIGLTVLGLVMVLSASSVTSYQQSGSSFTVFKSQAMFAGIGVVGAVIAARIPTRVWRMAGWPAFTVAVFAQLLVFTSLGVSVLGNTNWIRIAGFTIQPSEFGKLALILLIAGVLRMKRRLLSQFKHVVIPVVPCALLFMLLVMLGHDLGTTLVIASIVGAMLFVAGVKLRIFGISLALAAAAVTVLVWTSGNRMGRISTWLGGCPDGALQAGCWQPVHGEYALADGGWWGVGLGASREKWGWMAEAHNDFIFAILGEELGLPGTLTVLCLYAAIGYACYRLIATSKDFFVRIATAGVMTWILVQATINIASVLGLLPIIGVPLPLLSAGGSQLVTILVALGMLMSFARNEPECKAALAQRPKLVGRTRAIVATSRRGR